MAIRVPLNRETARPVLPDGIYQVVIEDVEDKVGRESGVPYMNLRLSVRKNGRPVGGSIWDIVSMSENAAFKLAEFLDAVGAPEEGDVSSQWFKGKRAYAKIHTEIYDNEPRNKVKKYLTTEAAEEALSSQENGLMEEDMLLDESPAPTTRRGRGRPAAAAQVEEMEEDEMPM